MCWLQGNGQVILCVYVLHLKCVVFFLVDISDVVKYNVEQGVAYNLMSMKVFAFLVYLMMRRYIWMLFVRLIYVLKLS